MMFSPLWHHAQRPTLQKEAVASKATTDATASCQCKLEVMMMMIMMVALVVVMMCQSPPKLTIFSSPPEIWGIKESYCRKERLHQPDRKDIKGIKNGRNNLNIANAVEDSSLYTSPKKDVI